MKNTLRSVAVFPVAGFVSGLCSGLTVIVQPLGAILPGVIFGAAISHAVHTSMKPLSSSQRSLLIVGSTVAYVVSIVVSLLSVRLPGFDNDFLSGAISGAIAGAAGAFVVALSLVVVVEDLRSEYMVCAVAFTGAVFGSLFVVVGVYISDHTAVGQPFDDIVAFPLWQVGVASAIPLFRVRSSPR